MDAAHARKWRAATIAAAVLIGAPAAPPAAALSCTAAIPHPTARESAFAVGGLFARAGVELTPTGHARLASFARSLETADIEVLLVRVPLASDTPTAEARRMLAQERALTLRKKLAQLGFDERRIHTVAAGPPLETEPVLIETLSYGSPAMVPMRWTCSALV